MGTGCQGWGVGGPVVRRAVLKCYMYTENELWGANEVVFFTEYVTKVARKGEE